MAFGIPAVPQVNSTKSINFLPPDLQETFSKNSCRFSVFSGVGDPIFDSKTSQIPLQNHTQSGLNNDMGDIGNARESFNKVISMEGRNSSLGELAIKKIEELRALEPKPTGPALDYKGYIPSEEEFMEVALASLNTESGRFSIICGTKYR